MISFIICSINPELAECVQRNIRETVGSDCECIIIDNREHPRSIAQVYNDGANRAKGDVLCFVHEDVMFLTPSFGFIIERKAKEPGVGVIGFVGSKYKPRAFSGCHSNDEYHVTNYIQSGKGERHKLITNNQDASGFTPVVTLDGFCLFTSKAVWAEHQFDEENITGFHGYDIDFCMTAHHAGLTNYVCSKVLAEHTSFGSFKTEWIEAIVNLHQNKWEGKLPLSAKGFKASDSQLSRYENMAWYRFLKTCLHAKYPSKKTLTLIRYARAEGLQFFITLKILFKYLYYRWIRHNK